MLGVGTPRIGIPRTFALPNRTKMQHGQATLIVGPMMIERLGIRFVGLNRPHTLALRRHRATKAIRVFVENGLSCIFASTLPLIRTVILILALIRIQMLPLRIRRSRLAADVHGLRWTGGLRLVTGH